MTTVNEHTRESGHASPRAAHAVGAGAHCGARVRAWWQALGLPGQFLLTASITLVFFAVLDEIMQTRTFEQAFRQSSAETASVYISGIIAPLIKSPIGTIKEGSDQHLRLDKAITEAGLKNVLERIKIWDLDGTIIYSTVPELVGRKFDIDELESAARGEIVVAQSDPDRDQDRLGATKRKTMLEIHVPIRDAAGRVIAVGEIHKDSSAIEEQQSRVVQWMWVFRSLSLLLGTLILFFIVKRAHTTIKRQRQQLHQQLLDTERLAEQNGLLRATADDSRRKAARANEELLSRVGAEIHDGPIQLLSVAMLGLNNFPARAPLPAANGTVALSSPDTLVGEVIDHLRTISTGLILPEIEHLAPREVIMLAVAGHERAAGTSVETNVSALPTQISQGLKACIYRIVQECLNNSARHAEGKGMKVAAWHDGSAITLVVSDRGPGFRPSEGNDQRPRLGLLGAKNRVVAFGGTLRIDETIGGVKVTAVLPIDSDEIVAGMPSG